MASLPLMLRLSSSAFDQQLVISLVLRCLSILLNFVRLLTELAISKIPVYSTTCCHWLQRCTLLHTSLGCLASYICKRKR